MQQMINRSTTYPRLEAATAATAGGALAGALAGALGAALAPLLSLMTGAEAWGVLAALGATVLGSASLAGATSAGVVLVGVVMMVALGGALGAVFGLAYRALGLTTDFGLAVYTGLGYGMLVFLAALAVVPAGLALSSETLLVSVLALTTMLGVFYTALCPAPYFMAAPA